MFTEAIQTYVAHGMELAAYHAKALQDSTQSRNYTNWISILGVGRLKNVTSVVNLPIDPRIVPTGVPNATIVVKQDT